MKLIQQIAETALAQSAGNLSLQPVMGGCVNDAYRLDATSGESYFLKVNQNADAALFDAEKHGLDLIRTAGCIRVPNVIKQGVFADQFSYLLMEFLPFERATRESDKALGRALAQMHQHTADQHGLEVENFIGLTPQPNYQQKKWCDFYRQNRLQFQLEIALSKGAQRDLTDPCNHVIDALDALLADHEPTPSLLHGDLWSGNVGVISGGEPVIFDPAVYFGDRETDIAMTELFGGFSNAFYQGYNEIYPLHVDYQKRRPLYQFYHSLNHFNLFGAGYERQVKMHAELALAAL